MSYRGLLQRGNDNLTVLVTIRRTGVRLLLVGRTKEDDVDDVALLITVLGHFGVTDNGRTAHLGHIAGNEPCGDLVSAMTNHEREHRRVTAIQGLGVFRNRYFDVHHSLIPVRTNTCTMHVF